MTSPFRTGLLSTLLLAATLPHQIEASDYSREALVVRLRQCATEADVGAVCRDFAINATDLDVVRRSQDAWRLADKSAATTFYQDLRDKEPNSARANYLLGRLYDDDPVKQIETGRKVIKLDPNWPYGYRLVAATYNRYLFDQLEHDSTWVVLSREVLRDKDHFIKFVELEPRDFQAVEMMVDFLLFDGQYDEALKGIGKGQSLNPRWNVNAKIFQAFCGKGHYKEALASINKWADAGVKAGAVKTEDRNALVRSQYLQALAAGRQWRELIKQAKDRPKGWLDKSDHYYIACAQAQLGKIDEAFKALDEAITNGLASDSTGRLDPKILPLTTDPRWPRYLRSLHINWEAGAEKRREEFLSRKLDKPALPFQLYGPEGRQVKLEDLRGEVVVLNFWTSPLPQCLKVLEIMTEFEKTHKPANVRFLAVNISDENPVGVRKFVAEHGVTAELLYGTGEMVKSYNVNALPLILAIDKEGKIRFSTSGMPETFAEEMALWIEELGR